MKPGVTSASLDHIALGLGTSRLISLTPFWRNCAVFSFFLPPTILRRSALCRNTLRLHTKNILSRIIIVNHDTPLLWSPPSTRSHCSSSNPLLSTQISSLLLSLAIDVGGDHMLLSSLSSPTRDIIIIYHRQRWNTTYTTKLKGDINEQ